MQHTIATVLALIIGVLLGVHLDAYYTQHHHGKRLVDMRLYRLNKVTGYQPQAAGARRQPATRREFVKRVAVAILLIVLAAVAVAAMLSTACARIAAAVADPAAAPQMGALVGALPAAAAARLTAGVRITLVVAVFVFAYLVLGRK